MRQDLSSLCLVLFSRMSLVGVSVANTAAKPQIWATFDTRAAVCSKLGYFELFQAAAQQKYCGSYFLTCFLIIKDHFFRSIDQVCA